MTNTYFVISEIYNNNFFWIKFTTIDSDEEVYAFIYIDSKSYYEYDLIDKFTTAFTIIGISITFEIDLTDVCKDVLEGERDESYQEYKTYIADVEFEKYLLSGLLILLGVQILINLFTILGFIPLTGIPFPLLSLGGSSIFSTAIIFGLINRVFIENNIVV